MRELAFDWTDPSPLTDVSFYYVRAYLLDGEMAWSSPIWALLSGTVGAGAGSDVEHDD